MDEYTLTNICEDYKKGNSLRMLSKRYNKCLSLLYYHLNKRGILRKYKIVKFLKNNNELDIGTFIGFWIGDGSKFLGNRRDYNIKFYLNKNNSELLNFIKKLLIDLFDKWKFDYYYEENTNKAIIRFRSKFIYNFINEYVYYDRNKALTIKLKNEINDYKDNFLKGLLLGLTLSDGSIKYKYIFTSISKELVNNLYLIFKKFGYNPYIYINKAHGYGKYQIYQLVLSPKETIQFESFINTIILNCNFDSNVKCLKGYNQ